MYEHRFIKRLALTLLSGLAAASLTAVPALAQLAGKVPPAEADNNHPTGPGSISGIWFGYKFSPFREGPPADLPRERPTEDGKTPELTPWARKIVDDRIEQFKGGHPFAKLVSVCVPDGVPAMMLVAPERPIEIEETKNQVTVLFEDLNTFRIIRLNAKHKKHPGHTIMGDSIGHWEGNTLVVDTIGQDDRTSIDNLIPHTEDLHVVERFTRTGSTGLDYRVSLDDPRAFKPYTIVFPWKKVPDMYVEESVCENQRNQQVNGTTTIQLKGGH